MVLLKFGRKEHLELLKVGFFHFRPLNRFITDSTCFRGDCLEGKLRYPNGAALLINGFDISPYIEEATMSYVGFENVLSFSLSMLNFNNCHVIYDDVYTPNVEFIEEMKQFGDYFLILPPQETISALEDKLKNHKCRYKSRSIYYCDKSDFQSISTHFHNTKGYSDEYDMYCFTKEPRYSIQNEYRIIIDDVKNEFPLDINGGINIKTNLINKFPIYETSSLNTLKISKDHLL